MNEIASDRDAKPLLNPEEFQKERVHPLVQWLNNEYSPYRDTRFDYEIERPDTHAGLILILAELCVEKGLVPQPESDRIRSILEDGATVFATLDDGNEYGLINEDLLRILFVSLLVPHMRSRIRRLAEAARIHATEGTCAPHAWEFAVEEAATPWGYQGRRSY